MRWLKRRSPASHVDNATLVDGVAVVRSARRKTVSLQIKAGKVRVLCPSWLPTAKIRALLREKQSWVEEKLAHQQQQLAQLPEFWLAHGEKVFIDGKLCEIKHIEADSTAYLDLTERLSSQQADNMMPPYLYFDVADSRLFFILTSHIRAWSESEKQHMLSRYFDEFCQCRAMPRFATRLQHWQQVTGLTAQSLKVRYYKSRWGSCDNRARLTLNNRLVLAPDSVLDYVIVHELCHIKHANHSPDFWSLVEHFYPQFQEPRRWLRQHQANLLQH
ncbi:M48 family metallopeptidase [Thalassotalea mangrovi]|uniref:M48 family metallopeptidase n=1 Tax=Thalassotalea mangrovi TaxID=2572245 RepID=A0A4U1B980_9GAMM|nr:SprT family zinc-dependent metalloprotease [Thalassotalea mangrovi]TKB46897.1 M48 family metallopeptidase [Thalassotalea mangrovi]